MANFNNVDIAILALFFISVLAGLMRGLIREILSLIVWIAAFTVAILFSGRIAASFTSLQAVQSVATGQAAHPVSMLAIAISFICLFVATLLVGSVITYLLSELAEGGGISLTNRFLGGVFGLLRGFLVVLLVIFMINLSPLSTESWWVQSQLVKAFQPASAWLDKAVEPNIASLKSSVGQTLKNVNPSKYIPSMSSY